MAAFDWYQATVPAAVDDVLEACMALTDHPTLRHVRGMHGYAHSTIIDSPDGPVGKVLHGGTHERPHVLFTGDQAEEGSECIRASFPEHFVTRLDPRVDYIGGNAYERIEPHMIEISKAYRVKPGCHGDHKVHMEGRSFGLGAPQSAVGAILYEKTAEQRAKFAHDPTRLLGIPENWVRFEARVMPQTKEARLQFASIAPVDAMGASPWLRALWQRLEGTEIQPVQVGKVWRPSDDDRAYTFMLAQYGNMLRRRAADHGGFATLGMQIEHDLAERDKALKKLKDGGTRRANA